ncbi:MAG: aminomethyl transferase family protein [Nitrospirae bacterium]|nr:aminomethyl transferase family protein [Candidatus Manganitrophaceae bacterium]
MQLLLHEIHASAGAHFSLPDPWELPTHYGNPREEYQHIRNGLALADLSHQGLWLITGDDRVKFLQGLISNDLPKAEERVGKQACLLTAKGKILSDFFLYPLSEGFLMTLECSNAEDTKTQLLRFRMRSKVEIERPHWGRLLISGQNAQTLIEKCFALTATEMQENSFFEKEIKGTHTICIKSSVTGEDDFHLFTPLENLENLWGDLLSTGAEWGIRPVGQAALETCRIEAGKPRYGIDMNEDTLPNEAGIQEQVISYTKGCFPGQEVIARIKTYGHVNKQLCGLILEGETLPKQGAEIFHDKKLVGRVTSTTKSPLLGKIIAMGYLRREALEAGTALSVMLDSEAIPAISTSLPFYSKHAK